MALRADTPPETAKPEIAEQGLESKRCSQASIGACEGSHWLPCLGANRAAKGDPRPRYSLQTAANSKLLQEGRVIFIQKLTCTRFHTSKWVFYPFKCDSKVKKKSLDIYIHCQQKDRIMIL